MLLLVGTPPRLIRSVSKRGEELLKAQRLSLSPVSAFSTPRSLPPVRARLSEVSSFAFVSVTKSPPSLPSKPEPPDRVLVEQPDPPLEVLSPPDQPLEVLSPPDPPFEALSPPDPPLEIISPPDSWLKIFSPPEPPDPPDALIALVFCDGVASLVKLIHPALPFNITAVAAATLVSLPHPLFQVLSQRDSNLLLDDELIYVVWYLGFLCGLEIPFTAVCSPFTVLCSLTFVVIKFFYHMNQVVLDNYCLISSFMEVVLLPISSSVLCGFDAGNLSLKIRYTSNIEVLIKGFVAMLKIVDSALVAASIPGVISLVVVSNFQGFVSLYSSVVVEIR